MAEVDLDVIESHGSQELLYQTNNQKPLTKPPKQQKLLDLSTEQVR